MLSQAVPYGESCPGRGNQKCKGPDMRNTQHLQGSVKAWLCQAHISVWGPAYDILPGSLPLCPACLSPSSSLLCHKIPRFPSVHRLTHFTSLVKLLNDFFFHPYPLWAPPFLWVLFSFCVWHKERNKFRKINSFFKFKQVLYRRDIIQTNSGL